MEAKKRSTRNMTKLRHIISTNQAEKHPATKKEHKTLKLYRAQN